MAHYRGFMCSKQFSEFDCADRRSVSGYCPDDMMLMSRWSDIIVGYDVLVRGIALHH